MKELVRQAINEAQRSEERVRSADTAACFSPDQSADLETLAKETVRLARLAAATHMYEVGRHAIDDAEDRSIDSTDAHRLWGTQR